MCGQIWRSKMTATQIDIDDEALAETMRLSGETTKKGAVNRALREYADRHRRIEALEHYASRARAWDYDSWKILRMTEKLPE
jgi:Arc/MetJ family transcription regulator